MVVDVAESSRYLRGGKDFVKHCPRYISNAPFASPDRRFPPL
jgi:hypothetical protein